MKGHADTIRECEHIHGFKSAGRLVDTAAKDVGFLLRRAPDGSVALKDVLEVHAQLVKDASSLYKRGRVAASEAVFIAAEAMRWVCAMRRRL
jgi:hypothetical protein